jgi:hypothetical protein
MNWDKLRSCIKGKVITSNDSEFAVTKAAMVWNEIKPNRSPEVIITVQDENDIMDR